MKVEITHDIACSWSALGFARFRRAAEEHRAGGGALTVVFRPYQTAARSAGTPQNGGPSPLASTARAQQTVRAAAADGLVMRPDRIVPADTSRAHRLIARAAAHGRAEDMAARLYRAHFTDGLDIADASVLRDLASALGVPWDAGKNADRPHPEPAPPGPRVPVFRFPDGTVLVGAVSLAALRGELRRAAMRTAAA
ncbi:hypothetical protein GCM10009527_039600 [Actinomadura nitritigenes]|uniref:DsbA family protein n=1 Tax=Actinomadura nitritigenes TaxID=134602 RepID=A0ABS3QZE2_9ACTN|nr:DsbA family protein [Actinomadura nitritigenes]MBO2439361.1 DsbA family protein [Actinomadura nitritigenes]